MSRAVRIPFAVQTFLALLLCGNAVLGQLGKERTVSNHAEGTFDAKMTPQAADQGDDSGIGRMTMDKQFHGDLEASSKGQMLAITTTEKGSAGYVALEKVTGTLKGRSGSFALQHAGVMNRGVPELTITVVPDSGTDQLKGLSGKLEIVVIGSKHSYNFEYRLPDAQ
jgi:uncharacterized protein DUF3224